MRLSCSFSLSFFPGGSHTQISDVPARRLADLDARRKRGKVTPKKGQSLNSHPSLRNRARQTDRRNLHSQAKVVARP